MILKIFFLFLTFFFCLLFSFGLVFVFFKILGALDDSDMCLFFRFFLSTLLLALFIFLLLSSPLVFMFVCRMLFLNG